MCVYICLVVYKRQSHKVHRVKMIVTGACKNKHDSLYFTHLISLCLIWFITFHLIWSKKKMRWTNKDQMRAFWDYKHPTLDIYERKRNHQKIKALPSCQEEVQRALIYFCSTRWPILPHILTASQRKEGMGRFLNSDLSDTLHSENHHGTRATHIHTRAHANGMLKNAEKLYMADG